MNTLDDEMMDSYFPITLKYLRSDEEEQEIQKLLWQIETYYSMQTCGYY